MRIGTLSFERRGNRQALDGGGQVKAIIDVVDKHQDLDLLVCSGHSLAGKGDLSRLVKRLVNRKRHPTILVEVERETFTGRDGEEEERENCMYVLQDGGRQALGPQVFGTSDDAKTGGDELKSEFLGALEERWFQVGKLKGLALCCGEINGVKGRNKPEYRWPELQAEVMRADIVVNPTHDRMGNPGTLEAKRRLLSLPAEGRPRLYISSSNWNTKKKLHIRKAKVGHKRTKRVAQRPDAETLHTIYVSGTRAAQTSRHDAELGYEFRWADVNI